MLERLEAIERRFEEVKQEIIDPEVMSDMKKYTALNKEYKELDIIVTAFHTFKNILRFRAGRNLG